MKAASSRPLTRTEKLRSQRSSQLNQKLNQVEHRATTVPRVAPVLTRGVVSGGPSIAETMNNTNRRQYYISLPATHTEVQMPSVPRIRFGWRLLSATMAVACVASLYFLSYDARFRVNSLILNGSRRIQSTDMAIAAKIYGLSIVEVKPEEMQKDILYAFPELDEVKINIEFPAQIVITIREPQPVLIWKTEKQNYWINIDGEFIPTRGEVSNLPSIQSKGKPPLLPTPRPLEVEMQGTPKPTATGTTPDPKVRLTPPPPNRLDAQMLEGLLTLSKLVPKGTVLTYTDENGIVWDDARGWKVYFGRDLRDVELRYTVYKSIADQLPGMSDPANGKKIKPTLISVESLNLPYYR